MSGVSSGISSPPDRSAPASLREAMSRFVTGVTVLSTGGSHIHGMTANAFTSVSLDPPTVLCCVARDAVMRQAIGEAGHFGVSVLDAAQEGTARYFADKKRVLGPDQFAHTDWTPGPHTGAPLLAGAIAWLECRLTETVESGDHSIFIGEVLEARVGAGQEALTFFDGAFSRTGPLGA
ncbi:MAG TPA: flavin reductase family protein [Streptomyces sp.]